MPKSPVISQKATAILTLIAEDHTYSQILAHYPELTCPDIFAAAREALDMTGSRITAYQQRLDQIRKEYPRAYEPWSDEEETRLTNLLAERKRAKEIALILGRQPSSISSRVEKLKVEMLTE